MSNETVMSEFSLAVVEWNDFVTTPEGEFELAEQTVIQYFSTIDAFGQFLNYKSPVTINKEDIGNYITDLRKSKFRGSTIINKVSALKSFFFLLESLGKIKKSPLADLTFTVRRGRRKDKRRRPRKALTQEEMLKLRTTLVDYRDSKGKKVIHQDRDQLIIELLFTTGLRRRELVSKKTEWGLTLKNVDIEKSLVTVRRKGGFIQEVVITDLVADIKEKLIAYIKRKELSGNDKIFTIGERWVYETVIKWGKRAGIEIPVTPHMLRHTFGSHLGDIGIPAQIIKNLMDHLSIRTTDQYVKTSKEGAMRVLSQFKLFSTTEVK